MSCSTFNLAFSIFAPSSKEAGIFVRLCAILILISYLNAIAFAEDGVKKQAADESNISGSLHTITVNEHSSEDLFENVRIGKVAYGSPAELIVVVQNLTDRDLELLESVASCNCIKVEIPEKLIKPGNTSALRMSFPVEGRSSNVISQNLRIKCKGQLRYLTVLVQAVPTEMITFAGPEYTFAMPSDSDESIFRFDAALTTTDNALLNKVKFTTSPDSPITSIKAILRDGNPVAEVVLDKTKINNENMNGVMELVAGSRYKDQVVYRFVNESRIRIHPDIIPLRSNGGVDSVLNGHGLVKMTVDKKKDAKDLAISDVLVMNDKKLSSLKISFKPIRNTIGHINVEVDQKKDLDLPKELTVPIKFRLSDGSEVKAFVTFQFP